MLRLLAISLVCLFPVQSFAYLDPGTGSIIIQSLVGAVAGIAIFWSNLKAMIGSFFNKSAKDDDSKQEDSTNTQDSST